MENRKDIEKEVEQTMHALDGLTPAETDSFFFTRLNARLEKEQESGRMWTSLWDEPRYLAVMAAILIVVIFNIVSVAEYRQYYEGENMQQTDEIATFADEYQLNVSVWYDTNEENNGY